MGKRVVDVDAETDRMARLFLGKEDEEQAKRRLKIVQVDILCTYKLRSCRYILRM